MTIDTSPAALAESVLNLKNIPDEATRIAVIQAFAKSVSSIWVVCMPMVGVGFLLGDGFSTVPCYLLLTFFFFVSAIWIRKYTLVRSIIQNKNPNKASADVERAETPAEATDIHSASNTVTAEERAEKFELGKEATKQEEV